MATNVQTETGEHKTKATAPAKRAKPRTRKAATKKARAPARTSRDASAIPSAYSRSGDKLLDRGRRAIADAYNWIGETSHAVPGMARKIHMPAMPKVAMPHVSMRGMIEEKPLLVGALGLGLGAIVGGLLIATGGASLIGRNHSGDATPSSTAKRKPARKRR